MSSRATGPAAAVAAALLALLAARPLAAQAAATPEPAPAPAPVEAEEPEPVAEDTEATSAEPGTPAAAGAAEPGELPEPYATEEGEAGPLGERGFIGAEISTGGGRDDSRNLDRPEEASDFYLARAALVLYERPSSRTAFTLAYEPEVERVSEGDDDSHVNHSAGVLLERQATRDLRWLVGGSLLDGDDPSRFLGGLQFVLPISPYRQSRAFASLERQLERTTFGAHLGWGSTEIEAVEGVMRAVDQTEISGQLSVGRDVGPRSSVGLGYAYVRPDAEGPFLPLRPEEDDPTPPPPDGEPVDELPLGLEPTPIHALTAGYRFRPRAGTELQLSGGAARDGYDRTTGIGGLELVNRGDRGSLRIRLDRSLVALGTQQSTRDPSSAEPVLSSGLLSDSVETSLTVGIHRQLAQWLWWEQLLWGARTSLAGDETLESLAATARLVFRTPWRVGLFAELDWFDQRSGSTDGLSRFRWAVGLRADAGGPPGTRGFEMQRERLLRVLPDRGGE